MLSLFRELATQTPIRSVPWKSITFEGGGFCTVGHCGALAVLSPNVTYETRYYGDSMGAFYAATAALFLHNAHDHDAVIAVMSEALLYVKDVQCSWLGNLGTCMVRLREVMMRHFPEDISAIQDRCFIPVTYLSKPYTQVISHFDDKKDLINTILASMHIPFWSTGGVLYTFRGRYAFDGAILNHCPLPQQYPCPDHYTVHILSSVFRMFWPSKDSTETIVKTEGIRHRVLSAKL